MKRGYSLKLIDMSSILITCLLLFGGTILCSQQADPFYFNSLQKGEKSFLTKNYRNAIKELEIAVFGLFGEKELTAKAYVYLSLSHYYQKNLDESERCLKYAADLMGDEEFLTLEIAESVRPELQELVNYFKDREVKKERPKKPAPEIKKLEDKESVKRVDKAPVYKLETQIKSNPRNVAPFYELFQLHRANNDLKAGKKTLKNLVKNNPNEFKGYDLLGTLYYEERKYKDAAKNFEKIFELTKNIRIDQGILEKAGAYLVLSTHLRGNKKRALTIVAGLMNFLSEDRINSLPLNERDKAILQGIIEAYKQQKKKN